MKASNVTTKLHWDEVLLAALKEDIPWEDVSANAVVPEEARGHADLIAKADGVLAGLPVFCRVFVLLDESAKVTLYKEEGARVKAGERLALNEVLDELDVRIENDDVDAGWVSAAVDDSLQMLKMKALPLREGLVPNVVGMGAKDAVYLLERAGMRVSLSGMGRVSAQSVRPGTRITKGRTVSLTLK